MGVIPVGSPTILSGWTRVHPDKMESSPTLRLLPGRPAVKLPVADAADEGVPLCRAEGEGGPSRILTVPDPDRLSGKAGDFHAVTVICAQRALNPGTDRIVGTERVVAGPPRVPQGKTSH